MTSGTTATTQRRRYLRENLVWALVAFSYLWSFPFFPRLNNPNENVRLYMTRALVENHTLDIARVESEWGWVNDKARNGKRVFSSKAPGVSYLGVPVLATQTWLWHRSGWTSPSLLAATLALRIFTVILPLLGFFFVLSRYLRRLTQSRPAGDLLLLAVACGSLVYPYGIQFVGHSLAAAASFGAFMVLAPQGRFVASTSARRMAAAGFLAGAGVLLEYQNILVAVLLTIYVVAQRPRLVVPFIAGALPAAVALGAFHALCFGHPWDFPYGHLDNLGFQATDHGRGFYGSSLPTVSALLGVLFTPGFGLLVCSPFLVLAMAAVGYLMARGPRPEGVLCAAVAVLLWFFLAGLPNWRGGWSVGPRYITAIVPFLVVALALVWPRVARWHSADFAAAGAAGLVICGVVLNASWAVVCPQTPPQVRNPVFQIVWRLLADGYAPYSIGYWLGGRGPWALLPVALALTVALAIPVYGLARTEHARSPSPSSPAPPTPGHRTHTRGIPIALAITVAALFLGAFSLWPRQSSAAEREALRVIKATWAPTTQASSH